MSLSHILILTLIIVILLRPRRVVDLFAAFGSAVKNFKDSQNEIIVEAEDIIEIKETPQHHKTQK